VGVSVVKSTRDSVRHRLDTQTDAGDFMTACGSVIQKNFALVTTEASAVVDCPGCEKPVPKPLTAPSTGRAARQYRRPKNQYRETGETLKFAHVEIVAAREWLGRGGEEQFLKTSLDRAMLAYRFLREMLIQHKRLEPDPSTDDYEE
jgi:hypothetical protein